MLAYTLGFLCCDPTTYRELAREFIVPPVHDPEFDSTAAFARWVRAARERLSTEGR